MKLSAKVVFMELSFIAIDVESVRGYAKSGMQSPSVIRQKSPLFDAPQSHLCR